LSDTEIAWGYTGELVYNRTYRRPKMDGTLESWPETVRRVVDGNLALVDSRYHLPNERDRLIDLMESFRIVPGGRHLWMSGVPGRQFLFNCHVSGWTEDIEDHFSFTFLRLMEGGGVGANYSMMKTYPIVREVQVYIVCDPSHPDYREMQDAGLLTDEWSSDWTGSIEIEDSREGWDGALRDLLRAATGRTKHTKRVYDVSRVRWAGARIKSFGGTASGPLPLARMLLAVGQILNNRVGVLLEGELPHNLTPIDAMEIDHAIATCVVSGGVRRSARMSILAWDDPHILDFLSCKSDGSKHWTTNISVAVDDRFFDHVKIPGSLAEHVFNEIVEGMLANGEPGIWNMDLSNKDEPNFVEATNPCGEITLEAWENCNLGHVNLDAFYGHNVYHDVWEELLEAHQLMARFLIRATYGDIQDAGQRAVVDRNRRIGVGHFGFVGMAAKQGIRFSETHQKMDFKEDLQSMYAAVRQAADDYAYELRIPTPVKVTTVAPTGTIAKMPGRTEGIHPPYAKYFIRRIRFSKIHGPEREQAERLRDEGYPVEDCKYAPNTYVVSMVAKEQLVAEVESLGYDADIVESADEISIWDQLAVQAMYQTYYADNAVSYTINIPQGRYTVDEVKEALMAYLPKLKGTTIFPDQTREQAPYERISRAQYEASDGKTVDSSFDEDCASGACPVR
jgi:ribonucleoside-triphosphate reductase